MTVRFSGRWLTLEQRFTRQFERGTRDDCWPWLGAHNEHGYGRIVRSSKPKRVEYAHRLSWELHRGPIPDGMCVLHKCDNPPCVNPAHLRLGDRTMNAADRTLRNRVPRGSKVRWALLTEATVLKARARRAGGESLASIARDMGINYGTVRSAISGKTWGWL